MSAPADHLMTIFGEALECASPAEQAEFLDGACGGDAGLRTRVEALLRAHQKAGDFLQGPPAAPAEGPGTVLGPYKLVEPIGEGGFGVVYMAEQQRPVRRLVALKVVKPGMDTRQVLARFEAERQALALMGHPNIAQVFDAGQTATGRPFFVMELVRGVPITDYCDRNRLTPQERLGLFVDVCRAVQHAHQKGVIHRDLKPSNVLVSPHDGRPVVKVIDFGIAKAVEGRLTDQTLVTGFAQVVGTPLYMSPEQAEMNALGVDTRSDVYSLGVLLYELLTGQTPFDKGRLREASFDELRRIIREEEPPRPSARISTLGPAAATVSEDRRTDPKRLGRLLRGELDWVVMRCLEKDRNRRYETADALARDVERYLADEPVEACPPSAGYRLRKFLRKHRRGLLTAAAFVALLLAGGVLAGWQMVREARAERDRVAEEARRGQDIRAALDRALALRDQARTERDPRKWAQAREQAERALALVESGRADEVLADQVRRVRRGLDEEAKDRRLITDLEAARLAQGETLSGENRFAFERANPLYREAFRLYGLPVGEGEPAEAAARLGQRPLEVRQAASAALDDWLDDPQLRQREPHHDWLRAFASAGLDEGGAREIRAASQERDPAKRRAALERLAEADDLLRLPPNALTRLARRLEAAGSPGGAVKVLLRAWQRYPGDLWVNNNLGLTLLAAEPQRWAEAARYLTVAVALRPGTPGVHVNLGMSLQQGGKLDEAIACYEKAVALDANYAVAHINLATALEANGRPDEAIASYRKALELNPKDAKVHYNLGVALAAQGQVDEAIACYRKALELNPKYAKAHVNLGYRLEAKGQVDEAIACYRKALEHDPKEVKAHTNLGYALYGKGQVDEAIACWRKALDLAPKDAKARYNLAVALQAKGRVDEAIACWRRFLVLDPKDATAHTNLGNALRGKGRHDEAIACYRQALEHDPKYALAHRSLGLVLQDRGQVDEAIACYRQALALNPKDATIHYNLGLALGGKGRHEEAIACFRKAIEHDPKYAEAHCNLGYGLRQRGDFRASLASFRTGHELGSGRKGWRYPSSAEWVKQAERLVQLDELLEATLQGKARPAGAAEYVELADFCRSLKRHASAVRFFTEAFTADPKLIADPDATHRYRAAGAAALAGCGQGEEAARLGEEERGRLRRQAREWLRADLDGLAGRLGKGGPDERGLAREVLKRWQEDVALAGVRGDALARLPAGERAGWQQLWADVAGLLKRAADTK